MSKIPELKQAITLAKKTLKDAEKNLEEEIKRGKKVQLDNHFPKPSSFVEPDKLSAGSFYQLAANLVQIKFYTSEQEGFEDCGYAVYGGVLYAMVPLFGKVAQIIWHPHISKIELDYNKLHVNMVSYKIEASVYEELLKVYTTEYDKINESILPSQK